MLVSLRHRLVVLATPKCGSTALETAFSPHMDVVISGHPQAKHTPFRKYDRFLRKYFETLTDGPLEVVCVFRHPLDWLESWWRYRGRDAISGTAQSTRDVPLEQFVRAYIAGSQPAAGLGRQAQFVSDKAGDVGVDQIWRYENLQSLTDWISDRLGANIELERLNISPDREDEARLTDATQSQIEDHLARDFEIYRDIAR